MFKINFRKLNKSLFIIAAQLLLLVSCVNVNNVKEAAQSELDTGNYEKALKELLRLNDKDLLENKDVLSMLASAYYGMTLKKEPKVADNAESMAASEDGKLLAFCDYDAQKLNIYTYPDLKQIKIIELESEPHAAAFDPTSKQIAVALEDNTIKIYDVATGELQKSLKGHAFRVRDVVYKDADHLFSCSSDCCIAEWLLPEEKMLWRERIHGMNAKSLCISKDKSMIASASNDGTAAFFPTVEESPGEWPPYVDVGEAGVYVNDVALSNDNNSLFTGNALGMVESWSTEDKTKQNANMLDDSVTALKLSSDGKVLLASTRMHIWMLNPDNLEVIGKIAHPTADIWKIVELPDGNFGYADKKNFYYAKLVHGQALIDAARKYVEDK